ncbi:MAG TPA: hypothetical protein VFU21_07355 [Kofleriaceae bacterium]|nr:hypothetical protein [Kofleriaceae bacterium]
MKRRLSPLLALVLLPLAGCTVGTSGGVATTSVECHDEGGELVCSEHEGDEAPDEGGDHVCSDTGCVTHCEEADGASHCVTECEHGMRCESSCEGEACSLSCTCPDGEEDGGGDDEGTGDYCAEHPGDLECYCKENPEHELCQDGGGDGDVCAEHPDDPACYCKEHPEDPECQDGGGEEGDPCAENPDGLECFCKENPEHAECQGA